MGQRGVQEELMFEGGVYQAKGWEWGRGGKSTCKAPEMGGSTGHWRK